MGQRWYWHIHHDILVQDTEGYRGIGDRKRYIKRIKPKDEIDLRFKLLIPAKLPEHVRVLLATWLDRITDVDIIKEEVYKLHSEQCVSDCPWVESKDLGFPEGTIFPEDFTNA